MPEVTWEDYRNVAVATLVPGSTMLLGMGVMMKDKSHLVWWENLRKPNWAPSDVRIYSTLDLLTLAPLGCASYIVYKYGGGFKDDETKLALGVYGAMNVAMLATIPAVANRNVKALCAASMATTLLSGASAYLFYRISPDAGYMLMPFAIWNGFYVLLTAAIAADQEKDTA